MIEVISLIQTLGGIVGGLGLGMFTKSGKVKAQADAYKLMAESYEYRINAANDRIKIANETEASHLQRISELNHALDDKTSRIRDLTDANILAEHELNKVNIQLVESQKEIADLRVELERYKAWHCRNAECPNRLPPNPSLKGKDF